MDKPVHSIEYKISSLFVDDGLENGVTEINGEVLIPDDEADELIAKCRYFFIDIDNSEYAIDYLLDVKGETAAFIALYDVSTSSFTDDIMNMFKGDLRYLNILIIDRIEILPAYRGCGLAKLMIKDAIRLFSPRTDLIALKAFPLQQEYNKPGYRSEQWGKMMKLESFEKNKVKATAALVSFYSEPGFIATGSAGIMVRSNVIVPE